MWLLFFSKLIGSQISQHNVEWCQDNQAGSFLVTIVMLACYQKAICSSLLCMQSSKDYFNFGLRHMNKQTGSQCNNKTFKGVFLCILM